MVTLPVGDSSKRGKTSGLVVVLNIPLLIFTYVHRQRKQSSGVSKFPLQVDSLLRCSMYKLKNGISLTHSRVVTFENFPASKSKHQSVTVNESSQ